MRGAGGSNEGTWARVQGGRCVGSIISQLSPPLQPPTASDGSGYPKQSVLSAPPGASFRLQMHPFTFVPLHPAAPFRATGKVNWEWQPWDSINSGRSRWISTRWNTSLVFVRTNLLLDLTLSPVLLLFCPLIVWHCDLYQSLSCVMLCCLEQRFNFFILPLPSAFSPSVFHCTTCNHLFSVMKLHWRKTCFCLQTRSFLTDLL